MNKWLRHKQRITLIDLMLVIFVIGFLAIVAAVPKAQAAEYWKAKFSHFAATAGETLAIGDVVCIASFDSRAYKADADLAGRKLAVGIVGKGGTAGSDVEIVTSGILAGQTAASAGSRLFLGTTAGALSTTANDWGQILGFVMHGTSTEISSSQSTTYYINVQPPGASAAYSAQ